MMEALAIVAGSWPIAVMVIGLAIAIVVRRSIKQAMNEKAAERRDRAEGNQAVVVRRRSEEG